MKTRIGPVRCCGDIPDVVKCQAGWYVECRKCRIKTPYCRCRHKAIQSFKFLLKKEKP